MRVEINSVTRDQKRSVALQEHGHALSTSLRGRNAPRHKKRHKRQKKNVTSNRKIRVTSARLTSGCKYIGPEALHTCYFQAPPVTSQKEFAGCHWELNGASRPLLPSCSMEGLKGSTANPLSTGPENISECFFPE